MKRRRSNIEIIAAILWLGQMGKTEIMYEAKMGDWQVQKYLDLLMEQGFIERAHVGNSIATYRTTEKGLALLELTERVLAMISGEDPIDSFESNQGPASEA